MDTLYTGDIPSEYHYASFGNGYIDLYNTDTLHNNTYTRYRVFTNNNGFFYSVDTVNVGTFQTTYLQPINTTNDISYRFDYPNILIMTTIFVLFGVWLFNLFTSIVRKGGVLGGLL